MPTTDTAIELPASRPSGCLDRPAINVHDPNYIPVLAGTDIKLNFSQPSFSIFPSTPKPYKHESQISLKRTKSASAPERVVQDHDVHSLPRRTTASRNPIPQEIGSSYAPNSDGGHHMSGSDDVITSSSEGSAVGAITILEEQIFLIPGNTIPTVEELKSQQLAHSTRSSISSSRKSTVPTSRYNKKHPSLPRLPSSPPQNQTYNLLATRGDTPEIYQCQPSQDPSRTTPSNISSTEAFPSTHVVPDSRKQSTRSTTSERRMRSLYPHPSNPSAKSRRNSVLDEQDEVALMNQTPQSDRSPSRPGSTRSRSQSICSQQPTPAPDTPLPELPLGVLPRPPTRERAVVKQMPVNLMNNVSSFPSPTSPPPQNDHMALADFMSSKKTTVFRRFDEVHVRLLLHLQDEISALEKELLAIEDASPDTQDRLVSKANVIRELRKVLAEYDHLFANWSSMQANQASDETKQQLAQWLRDTAEGSRSISKGARHDLAWLHDNKDLSSVSIDPEKKLSVSQSPNTSQSKLQKARHVDSETSKRAGGFLAFFGCASKRK